MSISKNNTPTQVMPEEDERVVSATVEHLSLRQGCDIRSAADKWATVIMISKTNLLKTNLFDVISPFVDGC